jgi:serine/threonine protein kinase
MMFLPAELASDPVAFERLQREARAASVLDHPNICSIYQLDEHEGQPFIVMQLLEGQTLREWIETVASENTPSRLVKLIDFAIQIAEGLEAVHQKGIIHRDIKPANIFITSREQVKILDFGVAKFVDAGESSDVPGSESGGAGRSIPERQALTFPDSNLTRTGFQWELHRTCRRSRCVAKNSTCAQIFSPLVWCCMRWQPAAKPFPERQ